MNGLTNLIIALDSFEVTLSLPFEFRKWEFRVYKAIAQLVNLPSMMDIPLMFDL